MDRNDSSVKFYDEVFLLTIALVFQAVVYAQGIPAQRLDSLVDCTEALMKNVCWKCL